jgi:adenosylcobinamide-GDP ribazoletransferase
VRDALRLAFGTLTVLPVRPPTGVDRRVAGWAMALAPLVGAVLGLVALVAAWGLSAVLAPLPVAVLVVGLLAGATRLIHWDGLADTADGLGSGRAADAALEVMRRSDTGPFGVFALVSVFAVQVTALAALLTEPKAVRVAGYGVFGGSGDVGRPGGLGVPGPAPDAVAALGETGTVTAILVAVVLGRLAVTLACRAGVPAARRDGLGHAVAGSVDKAQLVAGAGTAVVVLALAVPADDALGWTPVVTAAALSTVWAVAATWYLRRRLGGMTGDTLGALVETTTAVALVVLAAGL